MLNSLTGHKSSAQRKATYQEKARPKTLVAAAEVRSSMRRKAIEAARDEPKNEPPSIPSTTIGGVRNRPIPS